MPGLDGPALSPLRDSKRRKPPSVRITFSKPSFPANARPRGRALSIATYQSLRFVPASARNDPGVPTTIRLEKKPLGFIASVINNQVQSVSQAFALTNYV